MMRNAKLEIVVAATDLSESSERAVAWAAHLAAEQKATLVLAHAFVPPTPPPSIPEYMPLPTEMYAEERNRAIAKLAEQAAALRKGGLPVDTWFDTGPAVDVVIAAIRQRKADLLVVGTHSYTGWRRIFLGSNAARLIRKAPCPVLTVHPTDQPWEEEHDAHAEEAEAQHEHEQEVRT